MKRIFVILISNLVLLAGTLKEDSLPGIDIENAGEVTRFITTPSGRAIIPHIPTNHFESSRAEVLWVDRNHQAAIAAHTAISGNGMWIQAGWWLNNERTSLYRTLGTNTPNWSYPMSRAE